MARDDNKMAIESHIIGFYQAVSSDQGLRDASSDAEKQLDDFGIEAAMREDVFRLVDCRFQKGREARPGIAAPVGEGPQRVHTEWPRCPSRPEKRSVSRISKKRLSEIGISFQKTLNEEKGGLWLTPEELEGVPEDVIATLKKGEDGEYEGKLWLTFKYPDLFPTLKYAKSAGIRKKVFEANENKCNSNVPLFKEAIELRDEAARILGLQEPRRIPHRR